MSFSRDWQTIRAKTLVLDGFTCRDCNFRPAEFVVRNNPTGPYAVENLVSLCSTCKPIHDYQVTEGARHNEHTRRQLRKPVDRPATYQVWPT